jgi:putative transposase
MPVTSRAGTWVELTQMDHTLAEIIIVDSVHRRPIGRPWLSLSA